MARSRSKGGNSGTRYRAYTYGPMKGMPRVVHSLRGYRKRALSLATRRRIELEREALGRRNSTRRLEEGLALKYLADVPSVFQLAEIFSPGAGGQVHATKPKPSRLRRMFGGAK